MTIELPPEIEAIVQRELATGEYGSEADVVKRAVTLLAQLRLHALRAEVRTGLNELDHGEHIELRGREELGAFFDDVIRRGEVRWRSPKNGH